MKVLTLCFCYDTDFVNVILQLYVPTRIGLTCGLCYITNDGVELCEPTKFYQRFNSNQKFNYIEEKYSLKCWGLSFTLSLFI